MANLLLGSVYAGEVVVLRQLASVCALRDASRTLLETALADSDPPTAASRLEPARFLGGCQDTCSTVLSPEHQFHQLWTDVIRSVRGGGCSGHHLGWLQDPSATTRTTCQPVGQRIVAAEQEPDQVCAANASRHLGQQHTIAGELVDTNVPVGSKKNVRAVPESL